MRAATLDRPLVLASASPRRRELFGWLGLAFDCCPAAVDETLAPGETAADAVQRFAREKVTAAASQVRRWNGHVVVAADTIVVLDGGVFGKPRDAADAVAILARLRGRVHRVYTALSLKLAPNAAPSGAVACTAVPMRDYSDQEIDDYVQSGDPFDKAGAYAIQSASFRPVRRLTGCYANVMGLPLCHLSVLLQQAGVRPPVEVPVVCQQRLEYGCTAYPGVLAGTSGACIGVDRTRETA